MWLFPLLNYKLEIPDNEHPGSFGAVRKYDVHTGVDLYCDPGTRVLAVESGKVVAIENFTGPEADSPWWNSTSAVLIEGKSGVVLYGELEPDIRMETGLKIEKGQTIGYVKTVLKNNKNLPMTMLHIELYKHGTRESNWWRSEKPNHLLDPTKLLKKALKK